MRADRGRPRWALALLAGLAVGTAVLMAPRSSVGEDLPGSPDPLAEAPQADGLPLQRHADFGIGCVACHGTDFAAPVVWQSTCTACHGSYGEVAARTAGRFPDPHHSHMGEQACTDCHREHSPPVFTCNACHVFEVEMP